AVPLQDRDLADRRAVAVDFLELFGMHLFAAAQHQHLLDAARHIEIAVRVEAAEIARTEPPIGRERVRAGLRSATIAGEYVGSAQLDLADAGFVRLGDADLASLERQALGAKALAAGEIAGEDRGGLGQA